MKEMEEQLHNIYIQCLQELKNIGIDLRQKDKIGEILITINNKSKKRYGVCKQEEPDISTRYIEKKGKRKYIKYAKYNKHRIEISAWVMQLDESIVKNTIIHELIHCIPNCNNHGKMFKKYASYIKSKLGYDIKSCGNKKEDYKKSNIEYNEQTNYKYIIRCKKCVQIYYRQRRNKNLESRYRCGICGGKLEVEKM